MHQVWGAAYEVLYDGELKLQETEVESVHMFTLDEIIQGADAGKLQVTPDGLLACRKYKEWLAAKDEK